MNSHDTPQQLTLLPASDVPARLRLDDATRRRGLRHIAEIRQQLAARQAERTDDGHRVQQLPARSSHRPTAA